MKINLEETVLFIRGIPLELKREFKAACAEDEISMSESIKAFMAEVARVSRKRKLETLSPKEK